MAKVTKKAKPMSSKAMKKTKGGASAMMRDTNVSLSGSAGAGKIPTNPRTVLAGK